MSDCEEANSVEPEYESDADEVSALRWTARRMEASDDDEEEEDAGEEAKEKHRWSCVCLPRDESDGGEGSSGFYDELEVGGVVAEELEVVSQEGKEEVQETMRRVNKAKAEEQAVSDELVSVPRTGWFYMHDDRFLSRRYRTRRGAMIGAKSWECADGSKWKHDKFEDMTVQDKGAPKSNGQQQRKNRTKGHRYADTNQFASHNNCGNQNCKTSRLVRGRGPVKYKPIVKSNNLNPSSKHQIPGKLKEITTSSISAQVQSHTSSHDIFMPRRSNERYGRRNKQLVSPQMGGEVAGYCFTSQQTYQRYSIQKNQDNINGIPLLPLCSQQLTRYPRNEYHQTSIKYLVANSSVETQPQTTSLGHDLVGSGSFQFGGSPSLSPVIQRGGLPYGAVDDHSPRLALVRQTPLSQLGSRNGGKASSKT